jgi:hypothetical protein
MGQQPRGAAHAGCYCDREPVGLPRAGAHRLIRPEFAVTKAKAVNGGAQLTTRPTGLQFTWIRYLGCLLAEPSKLDFGAFLYP